MKTLKPYIYLQKINKGLEDEKYELSVLISCEDNLYLKEIVGPAYKIPITSNTSKFQTQIDLVFEERRGNISANPKPFELDFVLEPSEMNNPEIDEIQVQVNAIHQTTPLDHDGTSTGHLEDADGQT